MTQCDPFGFCLKKMFEINWSLFGFLTDRITPFCSSSNTESSTYFCSSSFHFIGFGIENWRGGMIKLGITPFNCWMIQESLVIFNQLLMKNRVLPAIKLLVSYLYLPLLPLFSFLVHVWLTLLPWHLISLCASLFLLECCTAPLSIHVNSSSALSLMPSSVYTPFERCRGPHCSGVSVFWSIILLSCICFPSLFWRSDSIC